jgi:hypothetical protein
MQGPEGLGQRTKAEVVRYLLNPTAGALLRLLGVRIANVVPLKEANQDHTVSPGPGPGPHGSP